MKNYLSICCIVKDENTYLEEWINYHLKVGVQHFYIYDNESALPIKNDVSNFISKGIVDVIPIAGKGAQFPAYNHCLKQFGKDSRWISFQDTDEFLVPASGSMTNLLKDYELFGGLGVNWLVFGSSGLKTRPDSQIASFTKRSLKTNSVNDHIKSIVQPRVTPRVGRDPHHFVYSNGFYCVNENFQRIDGPYSRHSSNKVQLNHYFLRSEEEFKQKITRGRGDGMGTRTMDEFYSMDQSSNLEEDLLILKHI